MAADALHASCEFPARFSSIHADAGHISTSRPDVHTAVWFRIANGGAAAYVWADRQR
jgi:hypothetical protein